MADHPLRPATRRSLGRPLPYQQADRPRARPQTLTSMERSAFTSSRRRDGVLSGISSAFAGLSQIRGQITHALLTRAPLYSLSQARDFSYDLHVLGTPPAFILSQDQTRHLNPETKPTWFLKQEIRTHEFYTLFSFQRSSHQPWAGSIFFSKSSK